MRALFGVAGLAVMGILLSCAQYPELESAPPAVAESDRPAEAAPMPPAGESAAMPPAGEDAAMPSVASAVYTPPTLRPAVARDRSFAATGSQVVRSIHDNARVQGLDVLPVDDARGVVVARYQGPATDYVDCGSYSIPGSGFSAPAVAAGLSRTITSFAGTTQVDQNTHLNTRLVALVTAQGNNAATVHVEGHYVLRRDLVFIDDAGREIQRTREFIDLGTDRQGRFSDGIACVATGALERSILPNGAIDFGS